MGTVTKLSTSVHPPLSVDLSNKHTSYINKTHHDRRLYRPADKRKPSCLSFASLSLYLLQLMDFMLMVNALQYLSYNETDGGTQSAACNDENADLSTVFQLFVVDMDSFRWIFLEECVVLQ